MIVLSDTSPINYLILSGHIDVLQALFGELLIPAAVLVELQQHGAPEAVREWIHQPPVWLVARSPALVDPRLQLGHGEAEAICLAVELHASLLLMDDRLGRREATARGIAVAGTLRVLEVAAQRHLLDLPTAIAKLRKTNFHISDHIIARALTADAERKRLGG